MKQNRDKGQGFLKDIGLAIASYEWIAALSLIIVAVYLLPRFLRAGIYTIPEFLEYRYNQWPRVIMGAGLLIMYAFVTLATVLYAGGIAIQSIFGLNLYAAIWVLGIFTGLYTMFGGLKAVVWTDVIQGTTLVIGGIVVTILAFDKIGGIDEFVKLSDGRLHTILPADHPELPWTAVLIGGMWLPNIFECLKKVKPGVNNEIQLTDAFRLLMKERKILGYLFNGKRYDIGNRLDFIKTNVAFGLTLKETAPLLKKWLKEL